MLPSSGQAGAKLIATKSSADAGFRNTVAEDAAIRNIRESLAGCENQGWQPIHQACLLGLDSVVFRLLELGTSVDEDSAHGRPMHAAIVGKHANVVRLLLERQADSGGFDANGMTPLHLAVHNDTREFIDLLLYQSASVNERTSQGMRPIHVATIANSPDCVQLLLERHAQVDSQHEALLPIHMAARCGNLEVMTRLLDLKADHEVAAGNGMVPRSVLLASGQGDDPKYQYCDALLQAIGEILVRKNEAREHERRQSDAAAAAVFVEVQSQCESFNLDRTAGEIAAELAIVQLRLGKFEDCSDSCRAALALKPPLPSLQQLKDTLRQALEGIKDLGTVPAERNRKEKRQNRGKALRIKKTGADSEEINLLGGPTVIPERGNGSSLASESERFDGTVCGTAATSSQASCEVQSVRAASTSAPSGLELAMAAMSGNYGVIELGTIRDEEDRNEPAKANTATATACKVDTMESLRAERDQALEELAKSKQLCQQLQRRCDNFIQERNQTAGQPGLSPDAGQQHMQELARVYPGLLAAVEAVGRTIGKPVPRSSSSSDTNGFLAHCLAVNTDCSERPDVSFK